jgi:hypothetical protein
MKEKQRMCAAKVGNISYLVPVEVGVQLFQLLAGHETITYTQVSGQYVKVILPQGEEYNSTASLESVSEFDVIRMRSLGETYMKEKEEKERNK